MNIPTSEERTIRDQRSRIEFLEEEIRQMRATLAPTIHCPHIWGLSPAEQRGISAFVAAETGFLTGQQFLIAVSRHSHAARCDADNLVKVHISNLRRKLKPFGVEIINRWGAGYEIPEASIALIRAAIEQRRAA